MRRFVGLVLVWLINSQVIAQDIPIGSWRTHFSYQSARHLEVTAQKIFCASEFGFFSLDLNSLEVRRLSKVDGLSDVAVTSIHYNSTNNVLAVGYSSGFVDLIFDDEIVSIDGIAASRLDRNKTIFDIASDNQFFYLATALGVVVLDISNGIIRENYIQIGIDGSEVEVFEVETISDLLVIRTETGNQYGSTQDNLLDFNNWIRVDDPIISIENTSGNIYGLDDSNILYSFSDGWQALAIDLPVGANKLISSNENLFVFVDETIYTLSDQQFIPTSTEATAINDLAFINNKFFIADQFLGLIDENGNSFAPSGPHSDSFSRIKVENGQLFAFDAPAPSGYDGSIKQKDFSLIKDGFWEIRSFEGYHNISDVAYLNSNFYYSSIGDGIFYEQPDQNIIAFPLSLESDSIVSALEVFGNTAWGSVYNSSFPIIQMNSKEIERSISSSILNENRFEEIDISNFGTIWLRNTNERITSFDPSQDISFQFSTLEGLPSFVTDITISLKDDAWISTTRGPALFFGASFISDDSRAITPSFENQTLFENELINSILTDGGNRLWFATARGLWLFDEDTNELLRRYTKDNSPLPSDNVLKLAYNKSNGEVFIATDKGMVSFRSASSVGREVHDSVKIFPSPVSRNYSGVVGISGLTSNASIKITDVNGNLVKNLFANGATASWDLTSIIGSRIVPGIYFFFSSDLEGVETFIGKIAVIE